MEMETKEKIEYVGPAWVSRELSVALNTARKIMIEDEACELMRGRRRMQKSEGIRLVNQLKRQWDVID